MKKDCSNQTKKSKSIISSSRESLARECICFKKKVKKIFNKSSTKKIQTSHNDLRNYKIIETKCDCKIVKNDSITKKKLTSNLQCECLKEGLIKEWVGHQNNQSLLLSKNLIDLSSEPTSSTQNCMTESVIDESSQWVPARLVLVRFSAGYLIEVHNPPKSIKPSYGLLCSSLTKVSKLLPEEMNNPKENTIMLRTEIGEMKLFHINKEEEFESWLAILQKCMPPLTLKSLIMKENGNFTNQEHLVNVREGIHNSTSNSSIRNGHEASMELLRIFNGSKDLIEPVKVNYQIDTRENNIRNSQEITLLPNENATCPSLNNGMATEKALQQRNKTSNSPLANYPIFKTNPIEYFGSNIFDSPDVRHRELDSFPWYHGPISRQEASAYVLGMTVNSANGELSHLSPLDQVQSVNTQPEGNTSKTMNLASMEGTFLVRKSESIQGEYVLTFSYQSKAKHLRMLIDENGQCQLQHLPFETIVEMLEHFKHEPIPLESSPTGKTTSSDHQDLNGSISTSLGAYVVNRRFLRENSDLLLVYRGSVRALPDQIICSMACFLPSASLHAPKSISMKYSFQNRFSYQSNTKTNDSENNKNLKQLNFYLVL